VELLSKVAGFSKYHFHRIFHSILGFSMGEYIRMVRLQESSSKLRSDATITQIALKSGYETHASFAKAFKVRFGCSPKVFSKKIKGQKGDIMIEPKIVDFERVEVLCVRAMGDYTVSAGEAFGVLMGFAYEQKIKYKKNLMGKDAMMFGIGYDDPNTTPLDELRYDACITYDDKTVLPKGEVVAKFIEGGKHLYYLHRGSYEGLKKVYADMVQYMIENELTTADRPPFERYLNRDPRRTKPENLKTEIYIPIK
jgi:AraC family transcriptional regulator